LHTLAAVASSSFRQLGRALSHGLLAAAEDTATLAAKVAVSSARGAPSGPRIARDLPACVTAAERWIWI
jgi:hypothetical protein